MGRKTTYCPKCGSTELQIEGARDEGRMAHCWDCGWGNWTNRVRYTRPKRAKPPCENLMKHKTRGGDSYMRPNFYCKLDVCIHPPSDKTVSCSYWKRDQR